MGQSKKMKMDMFEFQDYLKAHPPQKVSFYFENQPDYLREPLSFNLSFSEIFVFANPNAVGLKTSAGSTVCFECVKSVEVIPDDTALGDTYKIICQNRTMPHPVKYVLIGNTWKGGI